MKNPAVLLEQILQLLLKMNVNDINFSDQNIVFEAFCDLGLSLQANSETIQDTPNNLIAPICGAIQEHQHLFQLFILHYPFDHLEMDGYGWVERDLKVRSGIQFLLDNFSSFSDEFDVSKFMILSTIYLINVAKKLLINGFSVVFYTTIIKSRFARKSTWHFF